MKTDKIHELFGENIYDTPTSIYLDAGAFSASGTLTTSYCDEYFYGGANAPTVFTWYLKKPIVLKHDALLALDTIYIRTSASITDIMRVDLLNLNHTNSYDTSTTGPCNNIALIAFNNSVLNSINPYIAKNSTSGIYLSKGATIDRITVQLSCLANPTAQPQFASVTCRLVMKLAVIPQN